MVSIPGEITHGDTLRLIMRKNSCDQAWILFTSYTYSKNPKIEELVNKRVPVLVNDLKTDALAISARPFLMGYLVMFQVGQGSLSDIIPMFNAYKNYQITITDNDHFKAADYFDITSNTWDVSNVEPSIKRGQGLCIEHSEADLLKSRNFGKKSLEELEVYMQKYSLSFETSIDNWEIIRENLI